MFAWLSLIQEFNFAETQTLLSGRKLATENREEQLERVPGDKCEEKYSFPSPKEKYTFPFYL